VLLLVLLPACSDAKSETNGCVEHVVPPGTDLMQPVVSLRADLAPIFRQACAPSVCHGGAMGNQGVYIGRDAPRFFASTVGVKSRALPEMAYVTPDDPKQSFLMRKIDADHCLFDARCKDGTCGASMPKYGAPLDVAERDAIRRWIAQGARDN
jgi:hypothetical protein